MDLQVLLAAIVALAIIELASGVWKKTPLWLSRQCVGAFRRLWKESVYLHGILHKHAPPDGRKRFAQWRPRAARYVALQAIKARGADGQAAKEQLPQPVLDLLEGFLQRDLAVVLLGEPGAGKTTALEALTYRLARRAYRANILLWFALLLVAALPLVAAVLLAAIPLAVASLLSLLWLACFLLWEHAARRAPLPLFLEARSDYGGGDVNAWRERVLAKHLGEEALFGWRKGVALLVDGVNEVQAGDYGTFVEGWRSLLGKGRSPRVIFTSRAGEDPAPQLGLGQKALTVCDLDDDGVRQFLGVYGREKAAEEGKSCSPEQANHDFEELGRKNLLGEKGIGRNPYWLKMIVESGLYTRNRGQLFRTFAENLLRREIEEKPEERKRKPGWTIVPLEVEMDALGHLAQAMHRQKRIGFTGEEGWGQARAALRESLSDSRYTPDDVLGEAGAATLVRARYRQRVEFVHQLVQEFFTAYALSRNGKWQNAIAHAEDVWWWPTLFGLGGLLSP